MEKMRRIFLLLVLWEICFSGEVSAFFYEGEIDFGKKQAVFMVSPPEGRPLIFKITQDESRKFHLTADIKDLAAAHFSLTTVFEGTLEVRVDASRGQPVILGEAESRYIVWNHQPVQDLTGRFEIREGVFYLHSLNLGSARGQGRVDLTAPYRLAFDLQIADIDLSRSLPEGDYAKAFSGFGVVGGNISFSGTPAKVFVKGRLNSFSGRDLSSDFQRSEISFSGTWPVVYIADSNMTLADGTVFTLAGRLDLSDRKGLSRQMAALSKEPLVRRKGNDLEWTLKRIESEDRSGATEIKYLMRKNINPDTMARDPGDLLGVEHKIQF